jgi:hypothetical protein
LEIGLGDHVSSEVPGHPHEADGGLQAKCMDSEAGGLSDHCKAVNKCLGWPMMMPIPISVSPFGRGICFSRYVALVASKWTTMVVLRLAGDLGKRMLSKQLTGKRCQPHGTHDSSRLGPSGSAELLQSPSAGFARELLGLSFSQTLRSSASTRLGIEVAVQIPMASPLSTSARTSPFCLHHQQRLETASGWNHSPVVQWTGESHKRPL